MNSIKSRLASLISVLALLFAARTNIVLAQAAPPSPALKVEYGNFQNPPGEFRGTRWFTFAMSSMTDEAVKRNIESVDTQAYGGWMATPDGRGANPNGGAAYLNDEFFRVYRLAIEEGLKKNLPMYILYDEQQFPTGMAGGLLRQKYPDLIGRSLEKAEKDSAGPAKVELAAPIENGLYIGAVRMNMDTLEIVDISSTRTGEKVAIDCQIPQGPWKVMLFYLDPTANRRGIVDHLDAKAVDALIEVMYQRYYDKLKDYFGKMIRMTFYDEPAMHHSEFRGRLWSPAFNPDFQKKYGYSPMKYYPALWYDIGPDTAAARNLLFGFRTEMYTENFIGRIAKWCEAHGVKLGGHLDQEEAPNPVPVQGDLMKVFKHQHVPTHDDIWFVGRSNVSYKVVTSSAFNWDKPIILAETYAAYQQNYQDAKAAYRTAMDQHAMGINFQVGNYPRGVDAREFGTYLGRIQYMLQHGRHVADVAVLYPIAALQSAYRFASPVRVGTGRGEPNFYYALEGGILPPEIDYMQLGEMLYRGYRIDYTYLHPEVLEGNCIIEGGKLTINNKENREEFRVLFLPGGDTINIASAKKIQEFYNSGGMIIATSKLPSKSAELGKDREVQKIMDEVFGISERGPITAELRANTDEFKTWFCKPNSAGGKAFFLPRLDLTMMTDALNQSLPVRDVNIQMPPTWPVKLGRAYDGALTYIHKLKDGKDIYFFANSTDNLVDTKIALRGTKKIVAWNPHTGEQRPIEGSATDSATTVQLQLEPLKSVFLVSE